MNETDPSITRVEHDNNASAKRTIPLGYGGGSFTKLPTPLLDMAYDYIGFSNPDGNGNYQTLSFNTGGSGGTTVRTLTLAFDGSNNVTAITRS